MCVSIAVQYWISCYFYQHCIGLWHHGCTLAVFIGSYAHYCDCTTRCVRDMPMHLILLFLSSLFIHLNILTMVISLYSRLDISIESSSICFLVGISPSRRSLFRNRMLIVYTTSLSVSPLRMPRLSTMLCIKPVPCTRQSLMSWCAYMFYKSSSI